MPSINYNYHSKKTKLGFIDLNTNLLSLTRREGADVRKVSIQPTVTYPFQDNYGNRFKFKAKTTLTSYMLSHVSRNNKPDFKGYKFIIHPEFLFGWDLPLQKTQNDKIFFLKPFQHCHLRE